MVFVGTAREIYGGFVSLAQMPKELTVEKNCLLRCDRPATADIIYALCGVMKMFTESKLESAVNFVVYAIPLLNVLTPATVH